MNTFMYILLLVPIVSSTCPDDTFLASKDTCCKLCPAGTFLEAPCTVSMTKSLCKPCTINTFTPKENHMKQCRPCTPCMPSQIEELPCRKTSDRVCRCPDGKFLDPDVLYCVDCSTCAVGSGVVSNCSSYQDTVCEPCPTGTFSDAVDMEPCKVCSVCNHSYLHTVTPCTATTDTSCAVRNITSTTQSNVSFSTGTPSGSILSTQGTTEVEAPPPSAVAITLIVAVPLFFVLVSAIFFYLKKWFCFKRPAHREGETCDQISCQSDMATEKKPLHAPELTPAQYRSSQGLRGRRIRNYSRAISGKESSEGSSGSLKDEPVDPVKTLPRMQSLGERGKMLVRDLPGYVISGMAFYLNPKSPNDWIQLAGRLGFTQTMIGNIRLDRQEGFQNFIIEWGNEVDTTVHRLHSALAEIRREDAMTVLENFCRSKSV